MSDDSLYVIHGGTDFDKINPSRFGSGEPGNIRPLGKGLYSFVIDHEDPKRAAYAIDYAKRYSKKYGYESNAVHVFKIPKSISTSWNGSNDIDRTKNPEYPKKIEGLGGHPEKEYADFKAVDAKYQATKGTPEEGDSWNHAQRAYEKLKQAADVRFEHLPIGLTEASIHNPEVATRIGKFDLDTPTEDILGMVKNDVANVPHKDNGGGITAYQGGPHSVGEEGFLDEKIGTGEGAQAYGHGHYFAEAEPVAQGYRDALAQQQNPTTSINDLISKMSKVNPERMTPQIIQYYMKLDPMLSPHADDKEVVGHISEALNGQNADGSVSESAIDAYGKLTDKFGRNHKGHMHEVSINAHPDHFLDWDKPLSEQSEHVQNAFNSHKDLIHSNPYLDTFFDNIVEHRDGAEIYNELSHKNAVGLGDKGASNFLSSMGIHGIRYLDASSRSKGEGTRNYVVFDPKRVDIKRRYKDGGDVDDDGGITAYHGSQHDFDEFDTSKIGGGSGVQNFGHGLYFAEHEPAAEGYRYSLQQLANVMVGKEDANQINKGHMYEVNISAHPDHMLDWNKPLSEQSPYIVKSIFDARKDNPTLFNVFKSHFEKDSTGMDFYQALATQHPNGYQGASEFLQRSGVHGVKYRDVTRQGMKDGKPTTNYVVFDPKNVDVKRKYEQGGEVLPHDDPQRKENLDSWHEDSHSLTKNEDGSPKVYYHGTSKDKDFKKFNVGRHGAWVTDDPKEASMYAEANDSQKTVYNWGSLEDQKHGWRYVNTASRVMPVHVKITKPYTGAMPSHFATTDNYKRAQSNFFDHLRSQGFDGWIPQEQGGLVAVALSNPTQIKSSLGNNGNFDSSKPNINEARGGRIGYDYGGDVARGVDNPGGAADANRPAGTSSYAEHNLNAGSGTQTNGPSGGKLPDNRPDNRPDNSNDRFNIGGGNAPMPPQRGDDSFFGNMGGNIGSVLGGLAFGPLGSIGGRYLGNQFNQPDNSRFEAKNDEFGNPIGNSGGWLDFLGSGNPPAPMTSDNRRDPIKRKRRILMPDGTYQEVEEGMKSGGVAKSYNRVHNSKIVEHALSKVGVSLHTRRPPS